MFLGHRDLKIVINRSRDKIIAVTVNVFFREKRPSCLLSFLKKCFYAELIKVPAKYFKIINQTTHSSICLVDQPFFKFDQEIDCNEIIQ